jgi:hypothetical protein
MPVPEQFKVWNVQAVDEAKVLLQRGEALAARTAKLGDSVWAVLFSPAQRSERRQVLELAAGLTEAASAIDHEIVDYWRIQPDTNQGLDPGWFRIKMSTFAIVRDTVLRYANDAIQTIHDNQLRAITRATM